MPITGILLAAGYSRRFGCDKLLYSLNDGTPIVQASARPLKMTVDHAVAVVRPDSIALATLLREEGFEVVTDANTVNGMGASLACGIRASRHADAWVIALADMPFIQTTTFQTVVDLLRQGAGIVAPQYRGRRGHPVGFQQSFGETLSKLTGDVGAKVLLQRFQSQLTVFSCEDRGILCDIDTPQECKLSLAFH